MTVTRERDGGQGVVAPGDDEACYVYGIVPAGTAVPDDVLGLDDRTVDVVEYGALAAVVGVIAVDRPLGRRADLLAHSRVLDAAAARGAVIPVRFGSVLPDGADVVAELLAPHTEHLASVLESIAGRSQFNLRARYDEETVLAEVVSENREIADLRERTRDQSEDATYPARVRLGELVAHALESKRAVDGQVVLDLVVPHTVAYNVRAGGGLDHLIEVAFLVDADQRESFEAAAEQAATELSERARVKLLGPLAPYDFVPEE